MKNKMIGLFMLMFFIIVSILVEGGSPVLILAVPPALFVVGITGGLTIMYYKKGIETDQLLRRMKRYFIFSGYISLLISVIMVLADISDLSVFAKNLSTALVSLIYAYLGAYITDTFMK